MKNRIGTIAITAAALLGLAACGSDGTSQPTINGQTATQYTGDWHNYRDIRAGYPAKCGEIITDFLDSNEDFDEYAWEDHEVEMTKAGCDDAHSKETGWHAYAQDDDGPIEDNNLGMEYLASEDEIGVGKKVAQEFSKRHNCHFAGKSGNYRCGTDEPERVGSESPDETTTTTLPPKPTACVDVGVGGSALWRDREITLTIDGVEVASSHEGVPEGGEINGDRCAPVGTHIVVTSRLTAGAFGTNLCYLRRPTDTDDTEVRQKADSPFSKVTCEITL